MARRRRGSGWLWMVALGAALLTSAAALLLVSRDRNEPAPRERYRELALTIQRYTWETLAYAGGATDCPSAPYVTYRRDTHHDTISDHWYVALQLRADAALVRLGEEQFLCQVDKTVSWMERLWDPAHAGFAPRADLDGTNPTLQDVYADDNAIIGLAFLEAARVTRDPSVRARALDGAERAAGYLLSSGLWDDDLGGGLWWNNQRAAAGEGKPAQTTALMAHLMAELHAETGRPLYREWALSALDWLDRALWNPRRELYFYSINHPPDDPNGVEVPERYFGYDQAIVIQALLRLHRTEPNGGVYLARAQRLGREMDRTFWHPELGGYVLNAHVPDLYAPYSAWISEALLDLYVADQDPFWRERARASLEALNESFGTDEPGGYARLVFACNEVRTASGLCRRGQRWGVDAIVYTMTQAMVQRTAALLAAAY